MTREIDWFTSMAKRRVTVTEIANILGVTRKTAANRLDSGLSSDDLIAISRALDLSPIHALVELGRLTHAEAFDFLDTDGTLLASASIEQLVFRLAEDMLSPADKATLGSIARQSMSTRYSDLAMTNVRPIHIDIKKRSSQSDTPEDAVADSSPEFGGTLDDWEP